MKKIFPKIAFFLLNFCGIFANFYFLFHKYFFRKFDCEFFLIIFLSLLIFWNAINIFLKNKFTNFFVNLTNIFFLFFIFFATIFFGSPPTRIRAPLAIGSIFLILNLVHKKNFTKIIFQKLNFFALFFKLKNIILTERKKLKIINLFLISLNFSILGIIFFDFFLFLKIFYKNNPFFLIFIFLIFIFLTTFLSRKILQKNTLKIFFFILLNFLLSIKFFLWCSKIIEENFNFGF